MNKKTNAKVIGALASFFLSGLFASLVYVPSDNAIANGLFVAAIGLGMYGLWQAGIDMYWEHKGGNQDKSA